MAYLYGERRHLSLYLSDSASLYILGFTIVLIRPAVVGACIIKPHMPDFNICQSETLRFVKLWQKLSHKGCLMVLCTFKFNVFCFFLLSMVLELTSWCFNDKALHSQFFKSVFVYCILQRTRTRIKRSPCNFKSVSNGIELFKILRLKLKPYRHRRRCTP